MKTIEIYRDAKSGRLGYRVREERKIIQEELSSHTDVRKLRRQLRDTVGKSVRLFGIGT